MRKLAFAFLCSALVGCAAPVVRVDGFSWERSVSIESLKEVNESGWELPQGATLTQTTDREHHQESYTCFGPYYDFWKGKWRVGNHACKRPVNQPWYDYTIYRWVEVRRAVLQRSDREPRWPEVVLSEGEREGPRSETFWVRLSGDDSMFSFHCEESQWRSLKEKAYYRADIVGGEIRAVHEEVPLEKSDGS